ncbi:ABC-2 type transport system ATP-binding protein [Bowdeniella nasicola]|uniref:ABC-2 type transport system ATP-binding protein n=1 Tax=Bowdeniella nasicola TaxID=208480 RepID=A0A1H4BPF9_9ACTO|nr:ABC transporter ATP-binding protein [Bowdeniella nasicola]SEA50026.1 ABC-2 type transport system ATP-binding protein [Bowdeniella nasicola]
MSDLALSATGLTKRYGEHTALDGLNMSVPRGAIYGFIGSNGAGKTTTLRIALSLAAATSGTITVLGIERGTLPAPAVRGVSYLPDVPGLYPWLTAPEALRLAGAVSGTPRDVTDARIPALLSTAGLARVRGRIGGFSRGMTQRLGIATALISAPELLILDEPTSALDPLGRADVLALLASLRGKTTVLFSSHLLADVERVCTHVGMIHNGAMIAEGPIADVLARGSATGEYEVRLRLPGPESEGAIRDALADQGADIVSAGAVGASLQDVYVELTRGGAA